MAISEMTIRIPEELAETLSRKVPVAEQPEFVVDALRRSLLSKLSEDELDAMFAAACQVANHDPETLEIEREMDALPDTMTEEWNGSVKLPQAG